MKKFTLIEMIIIVAIIGILVSILLPSIANARKKAESAVCKSNLKQLGMGIIYYSKDNKDKMAPGWSGQNWNCISWDDYIGDYMGRKLTMAQKRKEWIDSSDSDSRVNAIFLWPSDKIPLSSYYPNGYRRSYAINENSYLGVAWRQSEVRIAEIASDTLVFSEKPETRNRVGKEGHCLLRHPEQIYSAAPNHHGKGKFNLLKMDHSAATFHYSENIGGGTPNAPQGMWTRAGND